MLGAEHRSRYCSYIDTLLLTAQPHSTGPLPVHCGPFRLLHCIRLLYRLIPRLPVPVPVGVTRATLRQAPPRDTCISVSQFYLFNDALTCMLYFMWRRTTNRWQSVRAGSGRGSQYSLPGFTLCDTVQWSLPSLEPWQCNVKQLEPVHCWTRTSDCLLHVTCCERSPVFILAVSVTVQNCSLCRHCYTDLCSCYTVLAVAV
jgi:hypothetical protein